MKNSIFLSLLCVIFSTSFLSAQRENSLFKADHQISAEFLLHESLYGLSKEYARFEKQTELKAAESPFLERDYQIAIAQIKMDESKAENLAWLNTLKYEDLKKENVSNEYLGDFYFIRNDFKEAIHYYEYAQNDSKRMKPEVEFRKAYSYFVIKDFDQASKYFQALSKQTTDYYFPSNYYYAMCSYFQGNYDLAIQSFEQVAQYPDYKKYTPYYLAHLYFAQEQHSDVINYLEKELAVDAEIYQKYQLHKVLGQAYLKQADYVLGLKHLEIYEANTEYLSEADFYQIALANYKLGRTEKAKSAFETLVNKENNYQVSSLLFLAELYLKENEKNSARSIFKTLSESNRAEPKQKEDALWSYIRLSAELGQYRESLSGIQQMSDTSPYYAESQSLLINILFVSKDYDMALQTIEGMQDVPNDIKVVYQSICLRKAKAHYNDNKITNAKQYFEKAKLYPTDKNKLAESIYWLALIDSQEAKFKRSNLMLEDYFDINPQELEFQSSNAMALYLKAHNDFMLKDYKSASIAYGNAIPKINAYASSEKKPMIDKLLSISYSRKGDAHFHLKEYDQATNTYNTLANSDNTDAAYGLYQKAIVEGLENHPYEKIMSLESIISDHPDSEYRDDAFFALGNTYNSLGKQNEAIKNYDRLILNYKGKSPLVNEAYLQLGLVSYNLGDAQASIENYKALLDNNPSSEQRKEALLAIQEIYVDDIGNAEKYIELAEEEGIQLSDFAKDSLSYVTAYNYFLNAKYAEATKSLSNYISNNPTGNYVLNAHYYAGESSLILKDYEQALPHFDYIITQQFSDHYIGSLKKAAIIAYNHQTEFDKAFSYYNLLTQQNISLDEKKAAHMGALRSAFRISNHAAVIAHSDYLEKSKQLNTEEQSTVNFYLGKSALATGDTDKAVVALNQVIRLTNNNQTAESSYLVSKIFFERGEMDIAETQCLETTKRSANYPLWVSKSLILLSDIYVHKGDKINAKAALEALIENYKDDPEIIEEATQKLEKLEEEELMQNRIEIPANPEYLQLDTIPNINDLR